MKIFIGLQEIAGYYTNLKKGFNEIGVQSAFVNLEGHKFDYGSWLDKNPLWANIINIFIQKIIFPLDRDKLFKKIWLKYIDSLVRIFVLTMVILRYDVIIFAFGYSFFSLRDLKILKRLGKKLIFVFNGSDARPLFIDGFILEDKDSLDKQKLFGIKIRKHSLSIIEKYSDYIINNSATGHHLTKPFLHFLAIGLPFTHQPYSEKIPNFNKRVRILHSPSAPKAKGTPLIRKTIQSLKRKGYEIDYIELINKTNDQVISEIQNCDFVIDQVYSDLPMAGFPTEAAYFGKPAIVGSYYADKIKNDIAIEFIPPSALCKPEELEKAIEHLIRDDKFRRDLGKKAQKFVEQKWAAKEVAKRYLDIINGKVNKKWIFDPNKITYTYGAALSSERVKKIVSSAVRLGGVEALQLSDKPKLEKSFLQMIKK